MTDPATTDHWREALRATIAAYDTSGGAWPDDERPLPPPELVLRVNAADKADPRAFLRSGAADLLGLLDAFVDLAGRPSRDETVLPERPTVMEFGCGVGRLLRHVPLAAVSRVVATDVNADCIAWCRASLRGIDCHHHGALPPIGTLASHAVDLIYANSVFTHIPLERQHAWLIELKRVLKPGGWLIATVLGRTHRDLLLDPLQQAALNASGSIQIHPETSGDPAGPPVAYGAVFQTGAQAMASFGAVFDVCGIRERPGSQDALVARRVVP